MANYALLVLLKERTTQKKKEVPDICAGCTGHIMHDTSVSSSTVTKR
jgi:hypothetical protein